MLLDRGSVKHLVSITALENVGVWPITDVTALEDAIKNARVRFQPKAGFSISTTASLQWSPRLPLAPLARWLISRTQSPKFELYQGKNSSIRCVVDKSFNRTHGCA